MTKEVGRPRKITVEELEKAYQKYCNYLDNYYEEVASAGKVVQIRKQLVGTLDQFLTQFLKISREAWRLYHGRNEYLDAITRVEEDLLARKHAALLCGQGNGTGIMFDLRVNHNWRDKQEIDMRVNEYKITLDLGNEDKTIK